MPTDPTPIVTKAAEHSWEAAALAFCVILGAGVVATFASLLFTLIRRQQTAAEKREAADRLRIESLEGIERSKLLDTLTQAAVALQATAAANGSTARNLDANTQATTALAACVDRLADTFSGRACTWNADRQREIIRGAAAALAEFYRATDHTPP